jgi:tyrosyl-tRNA synthetase
MQEYGLEPQVAFTVKYLDSWDRTGMSGSRGNYIGLTEPPEEQFGKAMRIPDDLLEQWWTLIAERPVPDTDAMSAKLELARFIVRRSWGEDAAREAEAHFTRVVRRHEAPDEVPEVALPAGDPVHLPALLVERMGVASTSEARRLIQQGGVKVNGAPTEALDLDRGALAGALLQVGKRRFARLTA